MSCVGCDGLGFGQIEIRKSIWNVCPKDTQLRASWYARLDGQCCVLIVVLDIASREMTMMVREDVSSMTTYCVIPSEREVLLDHPCWTSVSAAAP